MITHPRQAQSGSAPSLAPQGLACQMYSAPSTGGSGRLHEKREAVNPLGGVESPRAYRRTPLSRRADVDAVSVTARWLPVPHTADG